jgi:hypothetical protein
MDGAGYPAAAMTTSDDDVPATRPDPVGFFIRKPQMRLSRAGVRYMGRESDDDDDRVSIPREDLVNIRGVIADLDEVGGIAKLKDVITLIGRPGMVDALEELGANHETNKWRARFQADKAKIKARWWRFVVYLSGIVVAITAFIASLDGALTVVRGWFR